MFSSGTGDVKEAGRYPSKFCLARRGREWASAPAAAPSEVLRQRRNPQYERYYQRVLESASAAKA